MKSNATFYHAGCTVCLDAEAMILNTLDKDRYSIDVVHLGEDGTKLREAEDKGIKSVPALLIDGNVYHINFGASIEDLKG